RFTYAVVEISAVKACLSSSRSGDRFEGGDHVLICLLVLPVRELAWRVCSRGIHGLEGGIHRAARVDRVHGYVRIIQYLPCIRRLVQTFSTVFHRISE